VTERIPQEVLEAVETLYLATANDLFRYARTLPLDDSVRSDDLVQETFHAALLTWSKSRLGDLDLETQRRWLFKVLRNKAVDQWRAGKRIHLGYEVTEADLLQVGDTTFSQALSSVMLDRCWSAIARMPLQMRRVAFLLWNEDWPTDRVAAVLGISQSTVWSHVSHIRKQLSEEFGADLPFPQKMTKSAAHRKLRQAGGELS
jgi:RNA polymerase sigma factor (sigma-70 family)